MAFSLGPNGIQGAGGYYPYDNGGTDSGQWFAHEDNSDAGWVRVGNHQAGAETGYAKQYFKISQHDGSNGTIEYEIWNNGDANHEAGGLYLLRINGWYATPDYHTAVFLRCLGGNRTDLTVYTYRNSNGIWIGPGYIWGGFLIRRRGRDDRNWPGASYCAVANGGPLATATSLPSGVQASIQADVGYDIEDSGTRNG